jgi:hypothetical protein
MRPPHVRPRSANARYRWDYTHPRRIPPALVETIAGVIGGTVAFLAIIGALYLLGQLP